MSRTTTCDNCGRATTRRESRRGKNGKRYCSRYGCKRAYWDGTGEGYAWASEALR